MQASCDREDKRGGRQKKKPFIQTYSGTQPQLLSFDQNRSQPSIDGYDSRTGGELVAVRGQIFDARIYQTLRPGGFLTTQASGWRDRTEVEGEPWRRVVCHTAADGGRRVVEGGKYAELEGGVKVEHPEGSNLHGKNLTLPADTPKVSAIPGVQGQVGQNKRTAPCSSRKESKSVCTHGRTWTTCQECEISSIYLHQRIQSTCSEYEGSSICLHDRKRRSCRECGGSSICEHQRQRSRCKECKGGSICEHQRIRSACKECRGKSVCEHQRQRHTCKECGGASICEHQRIRSRCKDCGGGSICKHQRVRSRCKECGGGSICEHQRQRSTCKACKGSSICQHQRIRSICRECRGGSICEHQRIRIRCKECKGAAFKRKHVPAPAVKEHTQCLSETKEVVLAGGEGSGCFPFTITSAAVE